MDPEMMMGMAGMGGGGADIPIPDTSETVYISSLALLKMLKHGAWLPSLPSFAAHFPASTGVFGAIESHPRPC